MDAANNYKTVGYKFEKSVLGRIRDETGGGGTSEMHAKLQATSLWRRLSKLEARSRSLMRS